MCELIVHAEDPCRDPNRRSNGTNQNDDERGLEK